MPRVVFVNRYFHPDHSATSQIASDLAFHLASRGWEVAAITGRQIYDDPSAQLASGTHEGVAIERVWSTRFGRGSLAGRAVDYATFYLGALLAVRRHRHDVVVAMTDPPLISVVAALGAGRVVNWLQDLFPEVAMRLGLRLPRALVRIRDWSLRRAAANVAISEAMARLVPGAVVVHNWADAALRPVARQENRLRREWGLGDAFVVGYSGNFGRAHEFDTLARAMEILRPERARGSLRFLFVGGGARLEDVKRAAGPDAVFQPYQPREELASSLSAADAHLVTLEPAVEGLVVPSKFYGVLATGRPVILIGSRTGDLSQLVERHRCGIPVDKGDAEGLADAIRAMAADPAEATAMGERGLELYRSRFAPAHAFTAWERILEEVSS